MQKQIYRRDQELKLYREMLQDNNGATGISVSDFHIERVSEDLYQYNTLALNEIDAEVDDLPIQLRLKYFSINRGLIRLPEGFNPEFVKVTLRYPWIEKPQFDKKFVWQVQE